MTLPLKYILFFTLVISLKTVGQQDVVESEFLLKGHILNEKTKEKITNATVEIHGTDSSMVKIRVDSTGHFKQVLNIKTGYIIMVRARGYLKVDKKVPFTGYGKVVEQRYELQSASCSGLIPLLTYEFNDSSHPFIPDAKETDVYDLLFSVLDKNPSLNVEFTGYRDKDENGGISLKRAQNVVAQLIKRGIEKEKISAKDGGSDTKTTNKIRESIQNYTNIKHNRLLVFKIISSGAE